MSGFSRLFKGRAASDKLSELEEQVDSARQDEQALLERIESVEQEAPPDPEGLIIAEKRSIYVTRPVS